jgi:hypothetical protein
MIATWIDERYFTSGLASQDNCIVAAEVTTIITAYVILIVLGAG